MKINEDGMYASSYKYPTYVDERYREHLRSRVLQDLGIKLVEEIADTDQHYTIKVDTTDEPDYRSPPWMKERQFTARISVCPVHYRRMEMIKFDEYEPAITWKNDHHHAASTPRPSLLRRLWEWANTPIVYDGPMPSPRSVATTQKPTRCDPAGGHDLDWWDDSDREAGISVESP